jgi:GNAT superfamily N-acetyltransferase
MLAKVTSKNQLTLPKAALQAVGPAEYFDVAVREGQIVLTPVRIQRGDAVRAKLAALGLGEADMADAVRWARSAGAGLAAPKAAEPVAAYEAGGPRGGKPAARRKPARRA